MDALTFTDVEIHILPKDAQGYPVYIRSGDGRDLGTGHLPNDVLSWHTSDDLSQDGQRLFNTLFRDPDLRSAWDKACGQTSRCRVRLWIDEQAPELHAIPWELLHDGTTTLAANTNTPFSRYFSTPEPWGTALQEYSIRVLAVIPNPNDLDMFNLTPLDVATERALLSDALDALPANKIQLEFLEAPVTFERLERALSAGYHILHFVGHGTFSQRREQASLYFEDETGNTQVVSDDDLIAMLKRQSTRPHLVFLAACQSATRSTTNAFAGLGPKLSYAGVPAVITMQDKVGIQTVQKMTPVFYEHLIKHGMVDCALNAARSILITADQDNIAVPVLFMRLKEGKLWQTDLAKAEPPPLVFQLAQAEQGGTAVVGDNNVVTVINKILPVSPEALSTASKNIKDFISEHWFVLLTIPLVMFLLPRLYAHFSEKYFAKSLIGATGAVLFATVFILAGYLSYRRASGRIWPWIAVAVVSGSVFLGDVAWQTKQAIWPTQYDPKEFVIAVARFGEGSDYTDTASARDVTAQIVHGLNNIIQSNVKWKNVKVKPIGLIVDADQAKSWGGDVNADIVVWGQVFTLGEGTAWVHFQIIQTFDLVSNPSYPLILPVQPAFTQTSDQVVKPSLDAAAIDQLISEQSQFVTSFCMGLIAYFDRNYQEAIVYLEEAREILDADLPEDHCESQPDKRSLLYFYLGRSYQRHGELVQGEKWLWQAVECNPDDLASKLSIAFGYNSLDRKEDAQALAQEIIDLANSWASDHPTDTNNIAVDLVRAYAYLLLEEPGKAAKEFDHIKDDNPQFYAAYISAGLAYLEAREVDTAIDRFEQAIDFAEQNEADSSWAVFHLAEAYEKQGAMGKAQELYERAVKLAEVDWMYFQLAKFHKTQGDLESAEDAYDLMVEKAHNRPWARAERAKFYREQSRLEEAITELEYVCHERRKDALSWIYLAELYKETGQEAKSREAYEYALTIAPETPEPYLYASYGYALVYWGDYEEAILHFHKAVELNPKDGYTRFNLGRAFEANEQPKEARQVYRDIVDAPSELYDANVRQWAQDRLDALGSGDETPTLKPTPALPLEATLMPTPTNTLVPATTPSPTWTTAPPPP